MLVHEYYEKYMDKLNSSKKAMKFYAHALFVSALAKSSFKYLTYLNNRFHSCTTVHEFHMVP